ncbi:hypothetical protein H8E77_40590 [bacterium]|nr:hypothetical protein [bacterium]
MPFSNFKSIEQVIQLYPLQIKRERFLPGVQLELPALFMENLNFSLERQAVQESEVFFRESFIFPFLQQAWKRHPKLKLWVKQTLKYDDNLFGEPDYFVSVWTEEEVIDKLVNKPLLAVAEAKKQDFEGGWAQCLAELIACQKMNADEQLTVYGIVSTGIIWEFGKLKKNVFTRDPLSYTIADPQRVFGILDFVFMECEKQL